MILAGAREVSTQLGIDHIHNRSRNNFQKFAAYEKDTFLEKGAMMVSALV